ncbi:MAG TPA: hypothetical protein VFY12_03070 [Arenimonas sp.]|nr:hypothetical protein [Arenimonas sp.]
MTTESIAPLVPHRGEMLWLQRVLASGADFVHAEALIGHEHPFAEDAGVPAWTGIEFMAQAIAAWAGQGALARGEAVKPGFLLGTRRYQCSRSHFGYGMRLRVEAQCELFGDNGLGMFACRLLDGDEVIASANVSVYEPPNPQAYLQEKPSP